jgi:hypothetical protein
MNAPSTIMPFQKSLLVFTSLWLFTCVITLGLLLNDELSFYFATPEGKICKLILQIICAMHLISAFGMIWATRRPLNKIS